MEKISEFKKIRKKVMTFSINEEVAKKFNEISDKQGLNKSKVVESLIIDFINNLEDKK